MKLLLKYLMLLLWLFVMQIGYTQECWFSSLSSQVKTGNADFNEFIKTNRSSYRSYQLLYTEAPELKTNVEELILVADNLEEIEKIGSYTKWKKDYNVGDRIINDLVNSVDDTYKAALKADLEGSTKLAEAIGKNPELVDSWKKLFKEGNSISDLLRKDTKILEWLSKHGNNISKSAIDDLHVNLKGKIVTESFEDPHGRLLVFTESNTGVRRVTSIEKTISGEYKSFKYTHGYNRFSQQNLPPLSANKLTPDFSSIEKSLYPVTGDQKNIVRIKLAGKRTKTDGDFHRANLKSGITTNVGTPKGPNGEKYTWHHMDDFDPETGECTMQLVKTSDHEAAIPHTGSVKQYENYTGNKYID